MKEENSKINNLLDLAKEAIQLKDYNKAKDFFKKVISINKNIPEVHNNLGLINLNLNNLKESEESFNKAIKLKPEFSLAFSNLGIVHNRLGNFKKSEENYLQSIFLDKKNFITHYNLGNLYKDQNDLVNAEKYYKSALDLKPDMIETYKNLFFIYNRSNQLSKLEEILVKAKKNLGNHSIVNFFQGIYDFENKDFQAVIKNFEKLKIEKKEVGVISIKNELLAKSYDNISEYEKSFKFFSEANNLIYQIYKNKYKKENYIDLVNQRIKYYLKLDIKKWNIEFPKQNDPTFLVGFPRSGTTLLDTILRTHNSVEVIEEKPIVEEFVDDLKNKINNDFTKLENINQKFYNEMRNIYFEKRNKYIKLDKNKIYVDKLPLNLIFIGEIYRFFPNAKFIFAIRNPYDTVLSCFMQQFTPNEAMMNFTNLDDASKFYDLSMTLYRKYFELFKSNIFEIKYEDVVNDFDTSIKKLLKFLDVEWEESIKEFYITASKRGIISTPSFNQVNKPIYKKSINRWKNYEHKFKNIKPKLSKWITEFKY